MRKPLAALLLLSANLFSQQKPQRSPWLPTWTTANVLLNPDRAAKLQLGQQLVTLRQIVHISQGGKRLRVRFSNEFGTAPLTLGPARLAFLSSGSRILPQTDRPLLFNGQPTITIPPGTVAASDPLTITVPIFSDLVVSTAVPVQPIPAVTGHIAARQTTFIADGDRTSARELISPLLRTPGTTAPEIGATLNSSDGSAHVLTANRPAVTTTGPANDGPGVLVESESWFFLKDVEVDSSKKSSALVCFGDSITDGAGSTTETNRRWPDLLAPLLQKGKKTTKIAVLNAGIGGNRLLQDGTGPKASDRFDRDVLTQPGVRTVILLEGINDIGASLGQSPTTPLSASDLIAGYTSLAQRAHALGLRILGATLTPYEGAGYYTPEGEQVRQEVNAFLRHNTTFDGCIDFDKAIQDPQHPTRLLPIYDHGDHLHPSDLGYARMAATIPLQLFQPK